MIGAFIAKGKVASAFDALNRREFSKFLSAWREEKVFNASEWMPAMFPNLGQGGADAPILWILQCYQGQQFKR